MSRSLLALLVLVLSALPAGACNEGASLRIATMQLPESSNVSFDVAEQQSAEGGVWEVYNGPDGKPQNILRTDYGETGRVQLRLAVFNSGDYLIKKTQSFYSAPIYIGGGTIREETDYMEFCGAKLDMPAEGEWASNEAYAKIARESADAFFKAPELAKIIAAAGLKPPLWK